MSLEEFFAVATLVCYSASWLLIMSGARESAALKIFAVLTTFLIPTLAISVLL